MARQMGAGRGDFQQSWELPRIAIDGPFGTASEVSRALLSSMLMSKLGLSNGTCAWIKKYINPYFNFTISNQ